MKKFLISLLLVIVLLISLFGCSSKKQLSFSVLWLNSSTNIERNYSVCFSDNYNDGTNSYIQADADIYGKLEISGKYNYKISSCNINELDGKIDSEYYQALSTEFIFKLETNLDIDVVYKKIDETIHNDYITSTSYFLNDNALSPIYTEVNSKMSYLGVSDSKLLVTEIESQDITKYSKEEYEVTRSAKKTDDTSTTNSTKSYDYDEGTIIDNGYLLFALENLAIEKEKSDTINVVTPVYGESQSLTVSCFETLTSTEINSKTYNNIRYESFQITQTGDSCRGGNVGRSQVIYLAKNNSTDIIIKYISPLTSFDSNYSVLGSLILTLDNDD